MAADHPGLTFGLALGAALTVGCFDSDEQPEARAATTGTVDPTTTTTSTTTTSTTEVPVESTGEPDVTCRDAIACIQGCAVDIIINNEPEPDLSCFLDCEEQLTVPEALKLLRLANCGSEQCAITGECSSDGGTTGTTGGGSSSSTGGGADGAAADGGVLDPCLACIFALLQDPRPPGCVELAGDCD